MAFQGTVKSWNDMKGWGFILYDSMDVYMHVSECKDGRPTDGDTLSFDLTEDPIRPGQMKATNITGCTGPVGGAKGKGKGPGKGVKGSGSHYGVVKSFNDQKGWGFVTADGRDIFLHIKDCVNCRPVPGDSLAFDIVEDTVTGTPQVKAVNVTGGTGWVDDFKGGKGKFGGYGPSWDKGWGGGKGGKGDWGPYGKGGYDDWGYGKGGYDKGYGKGGFDMGYGKGGFDKGYGKGGFDNGFGKGGFDKGYGKGKGKW